MLTTLLRILRNIRRDAEFEKLLRKQSEKTRVAKTCAAMREQAWLQESLYEQGELNATVGFVEPHLRDVEQVPMFMGIATNDRRQPTESERTSDGETGGQPGDAAAE